MKFTIEFEGAKSDWLVYVYRYLGTEDVQEIRDWTDTPKLDISRIQHDTKLYEFRIIFEVSLEEASKIPAFNRTNHIKVVVTTKQSFDRFAEEFFVIKKCEETGEIIHASIDIKLSRTDILDAWKEAQEPMIWTLETKEEA